MKAPRAPIAIRALRDENDDTDYVQLPTDNFVGMAPKCKLVSYKVLDDAGRGETTAIIAALQHIQEVNRFSDKLKIHGVNLSVGYPIDPTWFACGQSPICVEVTRLVNSGVVVVVAAGNTGYGYNTDFMAGASVAAGQGQTINDPGNTDSAITVGSTHRDMPHTYGVSYFSSKGPTGDGRAKPDLIAPGEKIISCAAGATRDNIAAKPNVPSTIDYVEDSGTSMAAAHVSGVIAAFLSVRPEFIGKPVEVKRIFTSTATDPDGTIASVAWDFDYDGVTFDTDSTNPLAAHTYTAFGNHTVALQVTDNDGLTNISTQVVTVHAPPVASFTFTPATPSCWR